MSAARRLLLAVAPLLLSVLLAWLLMDGKLNLSGGEKDIVLVVPFLLWSLIFLCCFLILWWRRFALNRSLALSASIATVLVVIAALMLFWVPWPRYQ